MTTILELLDEIVDELTKPIPYAWVTDHGTTIHKNTPCLLGQLRDAVENPGNYRNSRKSRAGYQLGIPTLDFKALAVEEKIKATIGKYYHKFKRQGEDLIAVKEQLRSWVANVRGHGKDDVEEAYRTVSHFRNMILEVINPHDVEIEASCPRCNMRYAQWLQDGESIRKSALMANCDSVICLACGYVWDASRFRELGEDINLGQEG